MQDSLQSDEEEQIKQRKVKKVYIGKRKPRSASAAFPLIINLRKLEIQK